MAEKKTTKAKSPSSPKKSAGSTNANATASGNTGNSNVNPNTTLPADTQPVSTSDMVGGTALNSVIEGNETINIDDVRQRAYELYEERGGHPGNDAEDWFRAEQEVRSRRNGNASSRNQDDKRSA
jgi:hypothetical protein